MIDREICFNKPIKCYVKAHGALRKILLVKEMITQLNAFDYTPGCLLVYPYLKKKIYKVILIDLCQQQTFDDNPKPIQKINFTENLRIKVMFFHIEQEKETVIDFSQETVRVL